MELALHRPAGPAQTWIAITIALVFAGASAGCIEWDEQEIHVAFDVERDRLDALIVYRGLHSGGASRWSWFGKATPAEDVEGTRKQLEKLLSGRPMFAFWVPTAGFDLAEMRESDDPAIAALMERCAVDHGDFFRVADSRIDGWQHLRVTGMTDVVAMLDGLLARGFGAETDPAEVLAPLGCDDVESVRRWRKAVSAERRWLELRGSVLVMRIPASEEAARSLARRIASAEDFSVLVARADAAEDEGVDGDPAAAHASIPEVDRRLVGRPSEAELLASFLRLVEVRVECVDGGAELMLDLAARATRPLRLIAPHIAERYDLAPHLERVRAPIRTDVTDQTLRLGFAEFRRY